MIRAGVVNIKSAIDFQPVFQRGIDALVDGH